MFRSDDEEMNNAIRQAQDTLEQFLTVLQAPKPNQTDFEIKVHYDLPGDGGEHIWVNNLQFKDGQIHGLLYNDPVAIPEYSFGDPITVYPNAITDWKYVEDGKLVGGYTIRVIFKHLTPAEHEDFAETMGYRLY